MLITALACAAPSAPVLEGNPDSPVVVVHEGVFVDPAAAPDDAVRVDVQGKWVVPAFIDSHVHLAYSPQGEAFARGGVAAVVDLAAPTSFLAADHRPLQVIAAGPMIVAPGGYPTRSWGSGGYGLAVSDVAAAEAAVDSLGEQGARVFKVALASGPQLDDASLRAVAERAHARGHKLAIHALDDETAARGASIGADVLAHTPVSALSDATVTAWSSRAVISTLGAFGGDAPSNLGKLAAAGAVVLYGTDFGNTRTPGVDANEIRLLLAAGLTPEQILAAGTSVPAAYWGLDDLGSLEPGKRASFLVLSRDPRVDPLVLAEPDAVYIDGVRLR